MYWPMSQDRRGLDSRLMNFDYVIIGGGSAGCCLAGRLSEDPNKSVCLIEAGPTDNDPRIGIPLAILTPAGRLQRLKRSRGF